MGELISGPCASNEEWFLNEVEEMKAAKTTEEFTLEVFDVLFFIVTEPELKKLLTEWDIQTIQRVQLFDMYNAWSKWQSKKETKYGFNEKRTFKNILWVFRNL